MSFISSVYRLLPKLLNNKLAVHGFIKPGSPINVTFSVTNLCNSKCRTCSIWKVYPENRIPAEKELNLEEIEKIFTTIGSIYFFNISGGEPFLRKDLADIVELACRYLNPHVIHTPTNGILPGKIETGVREILTRMEKKGYGQPFTIKPSFDGVGRNTTGFGVYPEISKKFWIQFPGSDIFRKIILNCMWDWER